MNNKNIFCEIVFPIPLRQSFTYYIDSNFYNFENVNNLIGKRVVVDFGNQKNKIGVIIDVKTKNKDSTLRIKPIKSILDINPLFNKEQVETAIELSRLYFVSVGEFLNQFFPIEYNYHITQGLLPNNIPELSFAQKLDEEFVKVLKEKKKILFIPKSIEEKFKFYKNLILYSLKENLQTIILFSSNYYLEDFYKYILYLQKDFGEDEIFYKKIMIYSGEKDLNERYKIWCFVRHKIVNVILATKIGAFLPLENVSYILIDEPDSDGFVNNSVPMYNVYDIVNYRAKKQNIIYSSFVPSVRLMYENKKFVVSRKVEINTKIHFVKKKLNEIIQTNFYRFKKVIVFFPYVGYSRYYICNCCGEVLYDYKMKKRNKELKFKCPKCNSHKFISYGMGIEKFVEVIKNFLPKEVNLARLDSNVKENEKMKIINDFNNDKIDVIVSTYEIFNYLYRINFSNIGSIYFTYLDGLLNRMSYLSYENVYSMLYLFKILVKDNLQTDIYLEVLNKNSNVERLLYSYEKFYKTELNSRKELGYPPYCKILKIDFIYELSYKERIENLVKDLKLVEYIECHELELPQKIEEKKFKTSLFIKIFHNEKKVIYKIIEVLNKNINNNLEILVYIQFNPKD